MSTFFGPRNNRLLAAVGSAVLRRWLPQLECVEMPLGQVLYEPGGALSHAYFPTTAIVALLCVMNNSHTSEMAVVGHEGFVGIALVLGGESTPSRAVVHRAGFGFRLEAEAMKSEVDRGGSVLHLLLRYAKALMAQLAQMTVCNRHHLIDQQLCRWLLQNLDCLEGCELEMTQKSIAHLLGVRRESVIESASKLRDARVIRYSRGRIEVLDRRALEERSCECYGAVRREYERLLPAKISARRLPEVNDLRSAEGATRPRDVRIGLHI